METMKVQEMIQGASFDGNSYNSPPPVDLTGKEGVVDPNDLKQYDPPSNGGPIE